MSPKDKNVIDTLNLLTVLWCAQKQNHPNLTEEKQHTITITEEHLTKSDLSVFVLTNTLKLLNEKGYLMGITIYEDKYHQELGNFFQDETFNTAIKQIRELDINNLPLEQKQLIANEVEKMLPQNLKHHAKELLETDITLEDLLQEGKEVLQDRKDGDVATIILMPFRSIEMLLEKLNSGLAIDEVKDSGVWYDDSSYKFYFDGEVVSTSYQEKPNIEHYVLKKIPENLDEGVVWYDEIENHNSRSLKDALLKFVKKNQKLEDIFEVHHDRLVFSKEAFK